MIGYMFPPDGPPMQSVGDWLDSLGLPQYENTLVANGFDDMDFMVSDRLFISRRILSFCITRIILGE